MSVSQLDARGLKCPQPTLKLTVMSIKMKAGDELEVIADCSSFEGDVRDWCLRSKKTLMWIRDEGPHKKARILF